MGAQKLTLRTDVKFYCPGPTWVIVKEQHSLEKDAEEGSSGRTGFQLKVKMERRVPESGRKGSRICRLWTKHPEGTWKGLGGREAQGLQ